jgi:hypothetical protein
MKKYFSPYIEMLTKPSGHKLFLLLLGMVCIQAVTSMAHVYKWFLRPLGKISQNAYYHLMSYAKLPMGKFAAATLRKAIGLIDEKLAKYPVLLVVDDTLQAKFGTKFECWGTIFDHARHNGSSYLKGHCFVAMAVCVPAMVGGAVKYLTVPVRFRLRGEDESKLTIASEMVAEAMRVLKDVGTVILMCDSWYPKGEVLKTVEAHENLELIANVRSDTVMYDLPQRTGKRGRPAKRGKKLCVRGDFEFVMVGKYFMAARTAITNLFANPIHMTLTTANLDAHKSYRLFASTIDPKKLFDLFSPHGQSLDNDPARLSWLLPLKLYSLRWSIETMFYELKTFWSFGSYRLRSKSAIENFVSLISLSYSFVKLAPFEDDFFSDFSDLSPQSTKFAFADAIRKELFFAQFVDFAESHHFSSDNFHDLDILDFFAHSS